MFKDNKVEPSVADVTLHGTFVEQRRFLNYKIHINPKQKTLLKLH